MTQPLQFCEIWRKMNGPRIRANGYPGPDHSEPTGEVRTMADTSQYSDSAQSGKTEQTSTLTNEDILRCRAIATYEIGAIRKIVSEVAEATEVPFKAIMGVRRDARTVQARQLAYYIAHRQGWSLKRIGYAFSRDHTTILHGVKAEAKRRGEA